MLTNILPKPSWTDVFCTIDGDPDGGDGDDGSGGGGSGEPAGSADKGMTKAQVDDIVKGRVEQTRKTTADQIAKDLGVSIEDAKRIIKEAQDRDEAQKTEAQRAKDAADTAKSEADAEKEAAAKDRHDTKVDRLLSRAMPKDLDDDVLDKRVTKLGRLIDVEVGADEATIKSAIDDLRKEWPELFPETEEASNSGNGNGSGPKPKVPNSDLNGKPPKKTGTEDAFTRGQERAKSSATSSGGYPMLDHLTK